MFFYTFMPKLFNMSLTASVAIVLVILLRLLLKKAPKVISYALWGVVLFRLLCPVSIGSDLSVYNLFDAPAQESGTITSVIEYVPSNIVHTEYPSVTLPVPGISDVINEALPQGREQLVADPLEAPMSIATYVWMIGVLGMLIYSIVSYVRLRGKLSVVVPLRDNVFIADDIKSPFVVGLFCPKIYLPCNLGDKEQEYIILHEQHHIKRLDHVIKALAFLALAIHWFNPLVWVAFILASKDMEMSCDEAVIRKVGGDVRADYSASLLTLATGRRIIAGTPLAFGEGDTKGRINNLSRWKKPAVWVVLLAVVACAALGIGLLTNPARNDAPDYTEDRYSLVIGMEGVQSIGVSQEYSSGGAVHADGSAFKKGERVWLEQLDGITDLRGVSITAHGADGKILYEFSVPEGASDEEIVNMIGADSWLLAPSSTFLTDEISGSEETTTHELIPGTTYVSYQCLYMNPLSSYAAMGGDSGCKYVVGEDYFATIHRNAGSFVSVTNPDADTAASGLDGLQNIIDVPKWEWQEFPYTDEEWASFYVPRGFGGIGNISEIYDEMLYMPLTAGKFLLKMDDSLWLVELASDNRMGTYLWCIYSLVPESAMGVAQWEYAPTLNSRAPYFRFEFDMDYTEISAVCGQSPLVDFDAPRTPSDASLIFQKGNALYWSPVDKDGNVVAAAIIHFTVQQGERTPYAGTIYIEGNSGSDGRRIYTATIVGAGLHLDPNSEKEGGVISEIASSFATRVVEHDLTTGDLEVPVEDLANYVFYTNSEQISVTVKGGDFGGQINLLDVSQNNAQILQAKVNSRDDDCLFTGLTSARLYRVDCEDLHGCTVIVSGKK